MIRLIQKIKNTLTGLRFRLKFKELRNQIRVIEFKSVDRSTRFDIEGVYWSRIYEYPLVLDKISQLSKSKEPSIHNTSWGFEGVHVWFKNQLDGKYQNVLHSDIKGSDLPKTAIYDITRPPKEEWINHFDFVVNVSTMEEVNYNHLIIFKNLLSMVKPGGYFIATFDLPGLQLEAFETFLKKKYATSEDPISTSNSEIRTDGLYGNLRCGYMIVKKHQSTNASLENVFSEIYAKKSWKEKGQNETLSGTGSTLSFTESIRKELIKLIEEEQINLLVDTSCGEWNWMKLIQNQLCNYVGIDIVKPVIEKNIKLFENEKTKFIHGDFLSILKTYEDKSIDLILCRHTLEHLPTEHNLNFINECKRVTKFLLVTTYKTGSSNRNLNFPNETYRPICLEYEPYKNHLEEYFVKSIYDGSLNPKTPETYINFYKFN